MIAFPIQSLMDEQACYDYLLSVLHPQGLHCPEGHPLATGQGAQDRHRAPILDYRCQTCGAVFNLFTNTIWSKTRYSCATIVLILRGVAQGVPTEHLARELRVDRAHLLEHRHEIQKLIEQHFPPYGPERPGDRSR
jgi:transposase-like protein